MPSWPCTARLVSVGLVAARVDAQQQASSSQCIGVQGLPDGCGQLLLTEAVVATAGKHSCQESNLCADR